jgi:hypothetical protein
MRLKQELLIYRNIQQKRQILLKREDPNKFSCCYIISVILILKGTTDAIERNYLSKKDTNPFQLSLFKFKMHFFPGF